MLLPFSTGTALAFDATSQRYLHALPSILVLLRFHSNIPTLVICPTVGAPLPPLAPSTPSEAATLYFGISSSLLNFRQDQRS